MQFNEAHTPLTGWERGTIGNRESTIILAKKIPQVKASLEAWQVENLSVPEVFTLWRECADLASRTYDEATLYFLLDSLVSSHLPVGDYNKVWLEFYQGEYFSIRLELEKALDYYIKSVPSAEKTANPVAMFRGLLAVARTFYTLGEYRRAESQVVKLLSVSDNPQYTAFKAIGLFNLGQTCAKLGNYAGAEWYTISAVRTGLIFQTPLDVCLGAAETLSRLIHKKLIMERFDSARNLFLLTQDWLRKGLQEATSPEQLEQYLEIFLQEGLNPLPQPVSQ
jgi:tetratricopeptide (TPR) repeat protein